MNPIPKYINLDFSQECTDNVVLSQYDKNSRQIIAKLYNNGVAWNELDTATISTMTVKVFANKPDNTNIFETVNITGANEVTMLLSDQFSTADGTVKAKITIYDSNGEKVLSPLSFTMYVQAAPYSENAIVSTDSYSALDEMILNVQNLTVNIPLYVTRAETAATNAETSEANAQTYMTNAQTSETNASTYATNAQIYATDSLNSATSAASSATSASNSATSAANSAIEAINTVNAELVEATGTVDDSISAPLEIVEIICNSVQGYNSGKNKLQNTATTQTINGVTFTVNDDKTVAVNGIPTGTAIFYLSSESTLAEGSYILTGCPVGGGVNTGKYILTTSTTSTIGKIDSGSGNSFTVDENGLAIRPCIIVYTGAVMDNKIFYPMIRDASITDDNYEPYCGGIASPNPSYPQTIVSTGDTDNNLVISDGTSEVETVLNISGKAAGANYKNIIYLDTDGLWKKVVNTVQFSPNGNEGWTKIDNASVDRFRVDVPGMKLTTEGGTEGLSSHFTAQTTMVASVGKFFIRNYTTTPYLYVDYTVAGTTDLATFKTWLASSGVEFILPAETPTIEVLSDELQTTLNNLMSLDGTMTVTTDDVTNPDVVFRYARDSVTAKKVMENSQRIRTNERDISTLETTVGTADLTTTAQTIIGAINEIVALDDNQADLIGTNRLLLDNQADLIGTGDLTTTAQTIIGAINEIAELDGTGVLNTVAQTLIGAINELLAQVKKINGAGDIITLGTNCDSLTTPGSFMCGDKTIAATLTNSPYSDCGFRLEAKYRTASGGGVTQLAFGNTDQNNGFKFRIGGDIGTASEAWSAWKTISMS